MKRRNFLALAGLAAAEIVGGGFEIALQSDLAAKSAAQRIISARQQLERTIAGLIDQLPAALAAAHIAWTVDDMANDKTLHAYLDRIEANDLKMTLFVNSLKHSWQTVAERIYPLIKSGNVQLGNHMHHHYDLTTLSNAQVLSEIQTCDRFMLDNFGYDAKPFWRPPFGAVDVRVAKIAADAGYSTPTLWNKNLRNASPSADANRVTSLFQSEAVAGAILLDHTHGLEADDAFAKAVASLKAKNLQTLTLREAFAL